jgi:hypothetical protein
MSQRILTDHEIAALLKQKKELPENWKARLSPRVSGNSKQKRRDFDIKFDENKTFRIATRQSSVNSADFSIILTFVDSDGCEYRLFRFNGRHPSEHINSLERGPRKRYRWRNKFHIHMATERYQRAGLKIDSYATPTQKYNSFDSALTLFTRNNGFYVERDDPKQGELFPGFS